MHPIGIQSLVYITAGGINKMDKGIINHQLDCNGGSPSRMNVEALFSWRNVEGNRLNKSWWIWLTICRLLRSFINCSRKSNGCVISIHLWRHESWGLYLQMMVWWKRCRMFPFGIILVNDLGTSTVKTPPCFSYPHNTLTNTTELTAEMRVEREVIADIYNAIRLEPFKFPLENLRVKSGHCGRWTDSQTAHFWTILL